ncbi:MAG: stage 0 sporulation family protein [Clostridia bacterium]|nr:stage 0 sporulation family protein [Clostridia bacterium]
MQKVIGVRFGNLAKIYFFSPKGEIFNAGDKVVVQTALGVSIGTVAFAAREIDETKLDEPVKDIVRRANAKDLDQDKQNQEKSKKCLRTVREHAKKLGLQMKIVSATYTFDSSKVLIDFTAEERVDFRELLKILASELKARIELRQIGQRDEVKIKGGIGPCGEICCCSRFLKEFEHVTVKMAKNQGLSLSPTKISGLCGRLMCCLSYENATYEEVLARMPKVNAFVETPSGKGNVVFNDLLKEKVTVKIPQGEDSFNVVEFDLSDIKWEKTKPQNSQGGVQSQNTNDVDQQKKTVSKPEQHKQGEAKKNHRHNKNKKSVDQKV